MRFVLLTTLIAGICSLDNRIKAKREQKREKREFINGAVEITTYHNYGAFLNAGEKTPLLVKLLSFFLSLLLTVLFILSFTRYGKKELQVGLAFLLGGAFSNTYDRWKRGYVVDYLNFPKLPGKWKSVVYNISDFSIMLGACLIIIKQK